MPIYRMSQPGRFVPLEPTPFEDLEKVLEDWVEANSHLLFVGEPLVIIARQPRTPFGKYPDLIAIDEGGATVVIELKRGETPRDVLAQALEYAAWLDSLTLDQLDALAREYASRHGIDAAGVADLYRRTFEPDEDDDPAREPGAVAEHITFNNRQRLVIVAERFSPELEQSLRYLRTKLGADVSGIAFTVHREGAETVLVTETIVGRERQASAADRAPSTRDATPWSLDQITAWAQTDFLKQMVTAVPAWVQAMANPDVQLQPIARSDHAILIRGKRQLLFYFAHRWLNCYLSAPSLSEMQLIRSRLSDPASIAERANRLSFHVSGEADFALLKEIIEARVAATIQ